MPNTPNESLPYPAGIVGVPPDVRGDIQSLATAADTKIHQVRGIATAGGTDTGWSLTPITLASGWTTKTDSAGNSSGTVFGGLKQIGSEVFVKFRATRSGGSIVAGSTGNVLDTAVATIASAYRPVAVTYKTFFIPGVGMGSVRIVESTNGSNPGLMVMTSSIPSYTIANNDVIHFEFSYPAGS